jgi:parallel beta-helix repeat protein
MKHFALLFLYAFTVLVLGVAVPAEAAIIPVSTTIQATVDSANPGDTVLVPPGVYHESVLVKKDNLTIKGSPAAIIDAKGFKNGIRVGEGSIGTGADGFPTCPQLTVRNFKLIGLTIRNAEENGVYLIGVDGYHITKGNYINDHVYGIYPFCTKHGLIDFNHAEGSIESGIYVGESEKAIFTSNYATRCFFGFEVENSKDIVVRNNKALDNTTGILVTLTPGLPNTRMENALIEQNMVSKNNRPNPFPPNGQNPEGKLPSGIGIVNIGGDKLTIRQNLITENNSIGLVIVSVQSALGDTRIKDLAPDKATVRQNIIVYNGGHPDTDRTTVPPGGVDIFYDGSGTGNCFSKNVFDKEFPVGISESFPCP